jgi:hypothetical protein
MAEWKRFPLKGSVDVERWWDGVGNENGRVRYTSAVRSNMSADADQYPDIGHGGSSGFELASESMLGGRDQTESNLSVANRGAEMRSDDTTVWRGDNAGNERHDTMEGPAMSTVTQNHPLSPGERLAKSVQLARDMNHVYY